MKNKISVIIIAKNEEKMIEDCLKSINNWANEIVVIDSGSTDKTLDICRRYNCEIFKTSEAGFSSRRNLGKEKSSFDWIFYLDADERMTNALKKEITDTIDNAKFLAYVIPRRNFYLGKEVRFGGSYPDYVKRLFKKDKLKEWVGKLHEEPLFEGELGYLKEPMIHITHRDLSSMVDKTSNWSKIEADLLYKANHPPVVGWRILRIMFAEFWYRIVKLKGWRDGTVGWIEAIFQVFSRFITYARLWEMQNKKTK